MDVEKRIEAMGKELVRVRSRMAELGPIALGTLSASRKKYRIGTSSPGRGRGSWSRKCIC